jgi:hypothetical protein
VAWGGGTGRRGAVGGGVAGGAAGGGDNEGGGRGRRAGGPVVGGGGGGSRGGGGASSQGLAYQRADGGGGGGGARGGGSGWDEDAGRVPGPHRPPSPRATHSRRQAPATPATPARPAPAATRPLPPAAKPPPRLPRITPPAPTAPPTVARHRATPRPHRRCGQASAATPARSFPRPPRAGTSTPPAHKHGITHRALLPPRHPGRLGPRRHQTGRMHLAPAGPARSGGTACAEVPQRLNRPAHMPSNTPYAGSPACSQRPGRGRGTDASSRTAAAARLRPYVRDVAPEA